MVKGRDIKALTVAAHGSLTGYNFSKIGLLMLPCGVVVAVLGFVSTCLRSKAEMCTCTPTNGSTYSGACAQSFAFEAWGVTKLTLCMHWLKGWQTCRRWLGKMKPTWDMTCSQVPHRPQDRFARKETNIDQHHRKPHPVLMVVRALATPLRSSQGSPGQELLGSGDAPRCRTVAARILERGCCDPNSDRVAP